MGLVNAGIFLQTVQSYRLVWISGRFGGGKTSLSYKVAWPFLERGYRLITNSRCVWADDLEGVQLQATNHLKAVVILDEGGLWFKSSKQIEMVASYAAKMDVIYIIPSFWPPTKSAQVLIVQPVFNLKAAGVPLIIYKWRVRIGSFQEQGTFFWWRPEEIYGIYSRQDPGDSGGDIVDFLIRRTDEFRSRYGRTNQFREVAEITEADILQEAVSDFSDAVGLIPIPKRKSRR